ncbi:MAG TPA: V-type ATP synthase subunit F [Candidatus Thermoplasmatota archaeon]|nr:V-type ATP synthase subunit F [Candidatus Thermoplasmatota archaeon]
MKEIAVLGPEEFVVGFRLAGVSRTTTTDEGAFAADLEKQLAAGNVGILVVPGEWAAKAPASLRRRLVESIDPVVIQLGGEAGTDDLREKVKRAIGIDLYK